MTEARSFLHQAEWPAEVRVDFIERLPGIPVDGERDEVLARLRPEHTRRVRAFSGREDWWQAEQVHGGEVAVISGGELRSIEGVDGLVTAEVGEVLGIYVADCGPIWLADRRSGAVGVLHSGKKGTEANILRAGLEAMAGSFGTEAADVVAMLGPCIRPPHYEVDIAAQIRRQAEDLGIGAYHDCGLDTAADLGRFYSYRMEKGRTGRMLALILRGPAA